MNDSGVAGSAPTGVINAPKELVTLVRDLLLQARIIWPTALNSFMVKAGIQSAKVGRSIGRPMWTNDNE